MPVSTKEVNPISEKELLQEKTPPRSVKKTALLVAGVLSLALGALGIVLPVLPTTPFLLLAAFCFLRSSTRLYHWLLNHPVLGRYVYNYLTYRAVPKSTKVWGVVTLWASLLLSMYFVNKTPVRWVLLAVGIGVSSHILRLRTLTKEQQNGPLPMNPAADLPAALTDEKEARKN